MKALNKYTAYGLALMALAIAPSCVSEAPFGDGGEGQLRLSAEIRSDISTRADAQYDAQTLADKCVVYIENNKGVVRKFIGLSNIPQTPIILRSGHYLAEGWTGDSVSASFDKKFYRGSQEFDMADGAVESLVLHCNIANVIVSINPESLNAGIDNLKVTFSHSRGSLEFTQDNITTAKGYFMMPNADKNLDYKVECDKSDGSHLVKNGTIQNVERAHEYVMNITNESEGNIYGGGLIGITIEDIPVVEETVDIYGRPRILGEGFDLDDQIVGVPGTAAGQKNAFTDRTVYVRAYEGLTRLQLRGGENFNSSGHIATELNLLNLEGSGITRAELEEWGIVWEGPTERFDATGVRIAELRLTFRKKFFDGLDPKPTEYRLDIIARDNQSTGAGSKSWTKTLRIATTDEAVEVKAPVETAPAPDAAVEPMAVLSHSATVTAYIKDEAAEGYGIRYRKEGASEWTEVAASATARNASRRMLRATRASGMTRASNIPYTVTITGLEPSTTYEYQAYAAGYDQCEIQRFTTEGVFSIPNASMEEWGTYIGTSDMSLAKGKEIGFPGTGERTFWDSGNAGAAAANNVLTEKSTDMVKSGTYSAKLTSKLCGMFGINKFAAGNLFAGTYVKTDGTDGVLSFGREYDGSHPTKMRVHVNYRPAPGSGEGANSSYIGNGVPDQAQIYVALSTEPVSIETKKAAKLFNKDDACILAYGERTFDAAFGPDGALEQVDIPLEYYEKAKTTGAKYLIIVCSASKFGDYFSGGPGSVMYLDDFELVYEQ